MTAKKAAVKKSSSRVIPDPNIPDVAVEIDGETFRLCFDFGALAVAKQRLAASKVQLNLLRSIDFESLDVDTLPALFFAASLRYQPELTWARALKLVTVRTAIGIFSGLAAAYSAAMAEPDKKNPRPAADRKS